MRGWYRARRKRTVIEDLCIYADCEEDVYDKAVVGDFHGEPDEVEELECEIIEVFFDSPKED